MKVISLHPGITDIVCALGAGAHLVGRSRQCVLPDDSVDLPMVTSLSTGTVTVAVLDQLAPDLVFGYDIDPVERGRLAGYHAKIFSPHTLEDIWEVLRSIGSLLREDKAAENLVTTMKERIHEISRGIVLAAESKPSVAVFRSLDPPAIADRWVPTLVRLAGGHIVPQDSAQVTSLDILFESNPEILIIAVPGTPLKESPGIVASLRKTAGFSRLRAVRLGRVFVVDGDRYFYRPGPAVVESLELLAEVLHPGLFPAQHKERGWVRANL